VTGRVPHEANSLNRTIVKDLSIAETLFLVARNVPVCRFASAVRLIDFCLVEF